MTDTMTRAAPTHLREALRHLDRAQWVLELAAPLDIDNVMTARTLLAYVKLLTLKSAERLEHP